MISQPTDKLANCIVTNSHLDQENLSTFLRSFTYSKAASLKHNIQKPKSCEHSNQAVGWIGTALCYYPLRNAATKPRRISLYLFLILPLAMVEKTVLVLKHLWKPTSQNKISKMIQIQNDSDTKWYKTYMVQFGTVILKIYFDMLSSCLESFCAYFYLQHWQAKSSYVWKVFLLLCPSPSTTQ